MRVKLIKKGVIPILALLLFLSITVVVFSQDKQDDEDKQLREEILAVYQAKGDQGLRDFMKKKKNQITKTFIVDFAKAGLKERKEEWLKACEIMAEEKKDEKTLADVYHNIGEFFSRITNYKIAKDYFGKALPMYIKINDTVGQGNIYISNGDMKLYTGDKSKALEMYEKALIYFEKTENPVGQFRKSKVHLRKGFIYSIIGNYSRAIELYDKALSISKKSGDILAKGDAFKGKGDIYFYTGDNSNALKMYGKAQFFFEKAGDSLGKGNVLKGKGNIYLRIGDTVKALELYEKALFYFEKYRDPLGQGNVYRSIGNIYSITGEILKAMDMYDRALHLFKKAGDPLGQGNVYESKGNIYLRTGKILKAIDMLDKALPFFEKFGDISGQGSVHKGKGDFYYITGNNTRALEMYDKSLHFFEKAANITGQAMLYTSKAHIYLYSRNISKALLMYEKALFLFEKAGVVLGQGNVYLSKGDICLIIGYNSRAIEMYEKAFQFYEKVGYSVGLGKVYLRKGNICFLIGDNSKAFEMYDKALPFFEIAKEPIGQGNVYYNKGIIYLVNGEHSKALEIFNKALPFYEKIKSPLGMGNVFRGMGYINLKNGNNSLALVMYNKALSLYKKCGDIGSQSFVLCEKAKVFGKLGKKNKALDLFEKCIAKLETVRNQTSFSEMKRSFMETFYDQYEETVLFMLENKYDEKAFKYAEAMKSRVFLERMAEGLVRLDKGLNPELKEKRDNLVTKLSLLSKDIHQNAGGKDEKKLQELKEKYRQVENEFEELLIKIRLKNPLYASIRYPEPITVRELQKDVLKKDEILVRYFISPDRLYVFLVSKKIFKVVPLDVTKQEIKGLVEEHLRAIKENDSFRMKRYGKILYEKIFKPLEKRIKKSKDIIIVPDGELATIPFESFIVDNKGQARPVFLLEKYRVKYLQSASLLKILRRHYQNNSETISFIGFGDPVYDYENFKLGKPEKGGMKILATEITEDPSRPPAATKEKMPSSDAVIRKFLWSSK